VNADAESPERRAFFRMERILHEILNSREHAGDQVGVGKVEIRSRRALQQETSFGVNKERLLDAVHERVLDDDLRERYSRAPRLDAPLDPVHG